MCLNDHKWVAQKSSIWWVKAIMWCVWDWGRGMTITNNYSVRERIYEKLTLIRRKYSNLSLSDDLLRFEYDWSLLQALNSRFWVPTKTGSSPFDDDILDMRIRFTIPLKEWGCCWGGMINLCQPKCSWNRTRDCCCCCQLSCFVWCIPATQGSCSPSKRGVYCRRYSCLLAFLSIA